MRDWYIIVHDMFEKGVIIIIRLLKRLKIIKKVVRL